jgi:hypothetical protein
MYFENTFFYLYDEELWGCLQIGKSVICTDMKQYELFLQYPEGCPAARRSENSDHIVSPGERS